MIGHLRGTLLERRGAAVLIDVNGVGYEVTMSDHSLGQVGLPGSALAVRVFTHMHENHIALYGFTSAEERDLFDLLITVKNVGPASAIKMVTGGATPTDIASLIAAGKTSALQKLRGVGKKTAEMLVVELRDRCQELLQIWGHDGAAPDTGAEPAAVVRAPVSARPPLLEDVASALGQLGWRSVEVDKAVAGLAPTPDATLEGLLREALRHMPR
ncbi:MAG TPA: Holliday junction branch migration protein RuvA [Kofleriaceae bacterium]|nr:Holliday junction branch migration protein RuvA [Kofleriaceae bacterium]